MRAVMLTVVMCVGVAASAAAQDAKAKGQQLFTDQKCTLCHSIGDKGNKKGPLDDVGSKLSSAEIREWITDAKGMTAKTQGDAKAGDEGLLAAERRRRRARGVPVVVEKIAGGDACLIRCYRKCRTTFV